MNSNFPSVVAVEQLRLQKFNFRLEIKLSPYRTVLFSNQNMSTIFVMITMNKSYHHYLKMYTPTQTGGLQAIGMSCLHNDQHCLPKNNSSHCSKPYYRYAALQGYRTTSMSLQTKDERTRTGLWSGHTS
jgi:hypothetical protein